MAKLQVRTLAEFDSLEFFPLREPAGGLITRGPGTYTKDTRINGNSILSSVFVHSLDVGASVKVNWYDTTTGPNFGERFDLPSHDAIASGPITDRITVTRIHNKPVCEVVVTGGNAQFGVYGTVVSSFASDLDAALQFDDTPFLPDTQKGIPIMCLDESSNKLFFFRCNNGALSVDTPAVNGVASGSETIAFDNTATIVSYTPPGDTKLIRALVGGDGSGEFSIKINGSLWATLRNAWNDRSKDLPLHSKLVSDSDTITIECKNVAVSGSGSCVYEAFLYVSE